MRLVHIMLFSFWTFSSLILGYVILWVPEGIQIGNRMLLSKTSIYIVKNWGKSSKVSDSGPFLKSWWCILAWRACKKNSHNQICRQFVFFYVEEIIQGNSQIWSLSSIVINIAFHISNKQSVVNSCVKIINNGLSI